MKVTNAVAAELRSQTFTLNPTIRRRYVTNIVLKDLGTLYVDVQPGDVDTEAADRERIKYTCRVDIAVRKRFDTVEEDDTTGEIETDEIDRLLLLMQEIHDYFVLRRLVAYDEAAWVDVEFRPVYSPDHLFELRQFTGIVAVNFEVVK
ncbi:MAG TPA: hypothetical protein ENH78_02180 [Phycisphaerae bacterium]|nr:hypothetical protein [Phycisphaerae bacterium]